MANNIAEFLAAKNNQLCTDYVIVSGTVASTLYQLVLLLHVTHHFMNETKTQRSNTLLTVTQLVVLWDSESWDWTGTQLYH